MRTVVGRVGFYNVDIQVGSVTMAVEIKKTDGGALTPQEIEEAEYKFTRNARNHPITRLYNANDYTIEIPGGAATCIR